MQTPEELRRQYEESRERFRRSRFHKSPCPTCGEQITNQAMGRKAHRASCKRKMGAK